MNRADRLVGLVLVTLGVLLLVVLQTDVGGEAVVAMIGAVFLVAYAVTRAYGLLVPGGILTGLGTGIILESQGVDGGVVVLGLAAGFLGIALVDVALGGVQPARLWPLIPGGVLTIVGLSQYAWAGAVLRWWPVAVIAAGVWLIVASQRSRTPSAASPPPRGTEPPPPPPPADRPRATVPPSSNG